VGYHGHSISAWVSQDYPKSMRCLDRRSNGDVRRSAKTGSARFWVGLGTSQILIYIKMHTWMVRNECLCGNDFWVVTSCVMILELDINSWPSTLHNQMAMLTGRIEHLLTWQGQCLVSTM
jgi:hypothetical protein